MATARQAPAPQPSRRRREDTGRAAFTKAARKIIGRDPTALQNAAAGFLWDTLDWLNLWHGNDATGSSDLDGDHQPNPFLAPHL